MNPIQQKRELLELVHRLRNAEGTDEQLEALEHRVAQLVHHPAPGELIFDDDNETTDDEIVARLMSYRSPARG